ncbi:unnamed protein product [Darwinula stevensoni]|uniref:RRM domain-containing protein n=1 Tax=Darwinula stevensoni TaxID=69355 RepID=A0A7R8X5H4_9CRUS|nr:unnamed protein product [Darwinula stevensoni]CAG0880121.1 unnamed protein product [Darwinula stevensoni]
MQAQMDGIKAEESRTNLIVNYLPQTMTDRELQSMFITIGPIKSSRVMKDYKFMVRVNSMLLASTCRDVTEDQLEDMFSKFGMIVQKNLLKDKSTGLPRGVAFVRYDQKQQAEAAILGMNGKVPTGGIEPLLVKVAEEHGKQKAAFYAGWTAGLQQQKARGMGPNRYAGMGRAGWAGGGPAPTGAMGRGGVQGLGAMKTDRINNRYNPIGFGGGYNMYNWS